METILAAIMGALANLAEPAVRDGYEPLKALFRSKTNAESPVVKAVDSLQEKPNSGARRGVVEEEVTDAGLENDADVLKLAGELIAKLPKAPVATTHVEQHVQGNYNTFSGTGNATSTIYEASDGSKK